MTTPTEISVSVLARDRDASSFTPLFVLAPARSYSSVVVTMLGQHPELYGFPELRLFRNDDVAGLLAEPAGVRGPPLSDRLSGLVRALAQVNEGAQTARSVSRARAWLERRNSWRTQDVFDYLLNAVGPRVGVEKSPENSGRADFLARMASSYPRARYLHLVRHPVSTAVSMFAAWQRLDYWDVTPQLFGQFCLSVWFFHHRRICGIERRLGPDRFLRVRAEDVLNDPHCALPGICRWLGVNEAVSCIDSMCHPERSPYATFGPEGAFGGHDPLFLRDPAMRPAALPPTFDVPDGWVVDPWFHVAVIRLAHVLGYRHDCSKPPEPAVRG